MPRSVGIIMWSVCLLIENLHPQCLQLNAGRHGGLHYNNRSTKYCSAKRLVISLQWGLLPSKPRVLVPSFWDSMESRRGLSALPCQAGQLSVGPEVARCYPDILN